jgi:hypothetical protein
MPIPGHRSYPSQPPVPPEILDSFRDVAVVSDNMNRLHGTRALKPYHRAGRLAGTAVTIKTRADDNMAVHKPLASCGRATCSWPTAGEIWDRRLSARS